MFKFCYLLHNVVNSSNHRVLKSLSEFLVKTTKTLIRRNDQTLPIKIEFSHITSQHSPTWFTSTVPNEWLTDGSNSRG